MKLLLLSGPIKREGWYTLDANPAFKADYVRPVPPLNMAPESLDEVELIHGISVFHKWEAEQLLRELYVALVPGGKLILEQPNIQFAAEVLAGTRPPIVGTDPGQSDMWVIYGDPGPREPLHCNKWGWTPKTLTDALVEAGFSAEGITEKPAQSHVPGRDFRIEVVK